MPHPYTMSVEFDAPDQLSAQKMGLAFLTNLTNTLSGPRTGRWYPMPGNVKYDRMTPKEYRAANYHVKFTGAHTKDEIAGSSYQASAPGEPPAVRTGRLRNSFFMDVKPAESGGFTVVIKTNVHYADDLEYGTEKIDPRPFIAPTVEKTLPVIRAVYEDVMLNILRGGTYA